MKPSHTSYTRTRDTTQGVETKLGTRSPQIAVSAFGLRIRPLGEKQNDEKSVLQTYRGGMFMTSLGLRWPLDFLVCSFQCKHYKS